MKLVADKLTRRCSSHHRMMDSRQNPESARILIRVFGQWRLSPNSLCACTWKCTASRLPSPRIEACSSGTSFRRWVGRECVELKPESTNPNHVTIRVDRGMDYEIVGVVVGAVIGMHRDEPDDDNDC